MTISQTPTYNLGAVLHETGLAPDTLRAWERRYGVPKPKRTPGHHRLYSQRDIELLKWLIKRRTECLSISRAVEHWRELIATGIDPLQGPDQAVLTAKPAADVGLEALRRQWMSACLNFDETAAEQILNQAFAQNAMETVVTAILQGVLHEVGELWMQGKASIQQEHFVSALATRRVEALIAACPAPIRPEVIILGCAESELHAWPLLQLSLVLRRRGRKIIFLGANVPTRHLEETAAAVNAAVVVLCAERLVSAARLVEAARRLVKNGHRVAFGGWVFEALPQLWQRVPGQYAGGIGEAADRIEELVDRPLVQVSPRSAATGIQTEAYRAARLQIEMEIQQVVAGLQISPGTLQVVNAYFGAALDAALELGSVSYLEADLTWVRALLDNARAPDWAPQAYLLAYAGAMRRTMGKAAEHASAWLETWSSQESVK